MYKYISWISVILWAVLIFYLSHQPAEESRELSGGVTEVVAQTVEKVGPNVEFDIRDFHREVRKNAHFFIYLILGFLVVNALRASNVLGYRSVILALLICVLYAIVDEVHQLFIPGRSGEVRDVLIDTAGASVGIGVYLLINIIVKKGKSKKVKLNSKVKDTRVR
ncbi:VanZ family protein [Virgibacillus sp. SK37]|uniref:VanZ family protein n=1 Tax=Virgibacillus sp. SK37 TaxID=403957 RepID=UPI0004D1CEB7|nr:VanZ family protein [Virgibacillus sp. SK37]AIF44544.1 VanZ family protein [Virgibacillus sp. SK37]